MGLIQDNRLLYLDTRHDELPQPISAREKANRDAEVIAQYNEDAKKHNKKVSLRVWGVFGGFIFFFPLGILMLIVHMFKEGRQELIGPNPKDLGSKGNIILACFLLLVTLVAVGYTFGPRWLASYQISQKEAKTEVQEAPSSPVDFENEKEAFASYVDACSLSGEPISTEGFRVFLSNYEKDN